MRPNRVVASAALIAVLASVAVSASVASWTARPVASFDPAAFRAVQIDSVMRGETAGTTTLAIDPAFRSAGSLDAAARLPEPAVPLPTGGRPPVGLTAAHAMVVNIPLPPVRIDYSSTGWHHDAEDSWYGPGFYGQRTACGQTLTDTLVGVANRTLPCGTMVTFRNPQNGATVTVPVVDRGPYVSDRLWDLTKATCAAISHCWTGPLDWRLP